MKRYLSLLLCLLLCLSLCACRQEDSTDGSDESGDSGSQNENLRLGAFVLPYFQDQSLDPYTCPDGVQQDLCALLYEGLFVLDENITPQNQLCLRYSCDEDYLRYNFILRPDILFSDGSRVENTDVVASLERARSSQRYGERLKLLRSVKAEEDGSITVTLSSPHGNLTALLDVPITKADGSLLGTGPYQLISDGKNAQLQANPYWRNGTPALESIPLLGLKTSDSVAHPLSSHEIQALTVDLIGSEELTYSGSFSSAEVDTSNFCYLGFNTQGIFADANLRCVIAQGIDREKLVTAFLSGHARASQFAISPVSPLYPSYLEEAYSLYDYQQALAALGFTQGKTQRVTLLVNEENPFRLSAANYISQALTYGDLVVTVKALPWDEYVSALNSGRFDLYFAETRLTADWDPSALVCAGGSLNFGGYENSTLESILKVYASTPPAELGTSINALCSYLQQEMPIVPLCFKTRTILLQQNVAEGISSTINAPYSQLYCWIFHTEEETEAGQ